VKGAQLGILAELVDGIGNGEGEALMSVKKPEPEEIVLEEGKRRAAAGAVNR
jgi:hypothetical protein